MKISFEPRATSSMKFSSGYQKIVRSRRASSSRGLRKKSGRLAVPNLAHMGRPGLVEGTRELIEYPYIIVYKVDERRREIIVISVVHGARDREGKEE
jgi:toxin ParE1/3/4